MVGLAAFRDRRGQRNAEMSVQEVKIMWALLKARAAITVFGTAGTLLWVLVETAPRIKF